LAILAHPEHNKQRDRGRLPGRRRTIGAVEDQTRFGEFLIIEKNQVQVPNRSATEVPTASTPPRHINAARHRDEVQVQPVDMQRAITMVLEIASAGDNR
jgi:hypothetical protein